MLKKLAYDAINDVAIIQTSFGFNVRYGLQVELFDDLTEALDSFRDCQSHAMSVNFDV